MRTHPKTTVLLTACVAGVAALTATPADAATQTLPITADTFIDSSATPVPVGGVDEASYGADGSVKVVTANTGNSFSGTDPSSYTHALFQIPSSVITAFAAGTVTDVTVNYFPKNDSLASANGPYPGNANDGDDVLQLHPLTQSFTIGNGKQTPLTASTTGGATWLTSDGSTPWTTAGGDYDSTFVNDTNATLPASKGPVPFTWDITSLLANPITEAELATNGAILVLPDTVSEIPVGTQDFTSLYSANNTSSTPFIGLTLVPEPATASLLLLGGLLVKARRRRDRMSV